MRHRLHIDHCYEDVLQKDPQPRPSRKQTRHHRKHGEEGSMMLFGFGCCFLLICTSVYELVHFVHRPLDRHSPFWEQKGGSGVSGGNLRSGGVQTNETHQLLTSQLKCRQFGCPIYPAEVSELSSTGYSFIASQHHILLTHKSNRKKPAPINQDRAILISPFVADNSLHIPNQRIRPEDNFLLGIFDGHDDKGHIIAQFASEEVPSRIANKLRYLNNIGNAEEVRQAIIQTFIDVDHDAPPKEAKGGGCTASVILRIGSNVYLANTGDSTSYIAVYTPPAKGLEFGGGKNQQERTLQGRIAIHNLNEKHKPHSPQEKSRIEASGGRIHIPEKHPMGSRVVTRSSVHNEDVGLAMSRSIGDWDFSAVGVIPDPVVEVIDLNDLVAQSQANAKLFAVVGSDGLFDSRKVEFVARHLALKFFESPPPLLGIDVNQYYADEVIGGGKKLIAAASPAKEEWYRDDITFGSVTIELEHTILPD